MNNDHLTVRLKKLHCHQNDEERFDDVFIIFKGKQIWPTDKRHEDVKIGTYELMVNLAGIKPMEEVVLEVWDHDTFSPNDLYGKISFFPDFPAGVSYSADMKPTSNTNYARYTLDWEVIDE